MDIKEKLTQLYKEASVYAREAYGKRNHISDCCFATADDVIDYLIDNGVTITPAVPGPSEDDHNLVQMKWIPVTERLPENEKDVLIRAERKLYGIGKRGSKIASVISMAFHTDGKMNTEQSSYTWETEFLDAEYDEEADAYIIPEGWWESVTYSEAFSAVCDVVTHWMPLPEAPKEE